MKPKHVILAAALAGAAALVLFGETSGGGIAEPVARARAPAQRAQGKPAHVPDIQAIADRAALIGGAPASRSPEALFASRSWTPKPATPAATTPPAPPQAPPLPFTFIGKKLEDAHWEVYAAQGVQTHVLRTGDVIDSVYRVDAIEPPQATITYLPLMQTQTLNIGRAN